MKSIYTYYDYRRFITDYYNEKKATNPVFSYRYIAGKVGIDHALVVKIMQGTRHVSNKKIDAFIRFLKLSSRQAEYFRLLVAFGKAKNMAESKQHFEQLLAYCEITEKKNDTGNYEFYQHWYYTAVREILNIRPLKDDYQWLAEMVSPSITPAEAKRAVKLLLRLGLAERDADGFCKLTSQFLTTGNDWQSIAIRSFQKEACALAARALDCVPKEERDISTVNVSFNEEGFVRMKESLARCRRELLEIAASCRKVDRAYQLNLQLFPVSKTVPSQDSAEQL